MQKETKPREACAEGDSPAADGAVARRRLRDRAAVKYAIGKVPFALKIVSALIIAYVILWYAQWATETSEADALVQQQILDAERAMNRGPYATDGVWSGTAVGYGGDVTVEVTITDGYIDSVVITSAEKEDAPYLEECLRLLDDVVLAQTSSVDVVAGATYTSAGILNATTYALQDSNAAGGE